MRSYDLTPLFRSTVGFDRFNALFDAAFRGDEPDVAYPPYNIEKTGEDAYLITMAVAGFSEDELEVTFTEGVLVIRGKAKDQGEKPQYLHRGIGRRAFERRFQLEDHIRVTDAGLDNGMLNVELVRELPEAMKPRRINIKTQAIAQQKVAA